MDVDINAKLAIIRINTEVEPPDLPLIPQKNPSFRILPHAAYRSRTFKPKKSSSSKIVRRKDSYFHYVEPTAEELFNRVEYDMDLEDMHWLESYNQKYCEMHNFRVSENDFEKIMDRLEKESYFENMKSGKGPGPVVDDDALCAICEDGKCSNANAIVFCDLCDLAVHQECYGVPYIPEGQWLCKRCLKSPMRNVECCLCPNLGGAFKQTDDNRWAHVICALWIPEVCFANTVFLEPIDSINQIPPARWRLVCYICKQKKKGACIQCHKNNCYQSFHVTCARRAGLYMKISTCKFPAPDGGFYTDVKGEAFCDIHTPTGTKGRGSGMYSGDETDEDMETEDYRKKDLERKKNIKKTRKLLAEQREEYSSNDTAIVKVDVEKLTMMVSLFEVRGKRTSLDKQFDALREKTIYAIHSYWQLKRAQRNGVPLLRRLQVSFNGSMMSKSVSERDLDVDKYERLRYDLEKCRLLVGDISRREYSKKKAFLVSKEIIELKLKLIDKNFPVDEDNDRHNDKTHSNDIAHSNGKTHNKTPANFTNNINANNNNISNSNNNQKQQDSALIITESNGLPNGQ